jgi:hypothetical protein
LSLKDKLDAIKTFIDLPMAAVTLLPVVSGWVLKLREVSLPVEVDLVWFIPAVVLLLWVAIFVVPRMIPRLRLARLSAKAPKYWEDMKAAIRAFHKTDIDSERAIADREYRMLRRILMELVIHHRVELMAEIAKKNPSAPSVSIFLETPAHLCLS